MIRTAHILFLACTLTLLPSFREAGVKKTLLVAEYDLKVATNNLQHLFAYHFTDGVFISKEKIVSVAGKKEGATGSYIRFDLGQSKVYRNRYVITGIGNVIDVQEKKVLLDQKDQFVKTSGDSIVFYTNDIFKGKYYSYLNLKDGTYNEIHNLLYKALPEKDIEVDQSGRLFKIWYYPPNANKIMLVNDAGYGEDASARKEKAVKVPLTWVDNTSFVFPHYNQTRNVCTMYRVYTETKIKEPLGEIDNPASLPYNSYFYRDAMGALVYVCGKGNFEVDLKKKKLTPLSAEDLGNGFSAGLVEKPEVGRSLYYNEKEVGKYFCDHRKAKTTPGMLAVHYDIVINGERYPQSVSIWESKSGKWREIDVMDVAAVVGWVDN